MILPDPIQNAAHELNALRDKVIGGTRITNEECELLFEKADLSFVGALANLIRERKHGSKTYFNRNFHIEPTNICVYTCSFCSYSRLIKRREEGWEYSLEEMMDQVRAYDGKDITEVHIVGGVMPKYDLDFYCELFRSIRAHRPEIHIKALTPVEYHYIFKKAKVSYEEGLRMIKEAGVDSMPGGGAEIFDEKIRTQIAGGKCSSEEWLRMHEIWHGMGMKSNSTILYGHIESFAQRVDHLDRLRKLQDRTGGFQTFIFLKFRNKNNEMSYLDEVPAIEDLRNFAICRIYLDNFDHLKAYWPMLGRHYAQLALSFGVDDVDGTIDDSTRIYSMAGSEEQNPSMTTSDLVKLICSTGRRAIERDSVYNELREYKEEDFEESSSLRYYSLPTT